MQSVILYFVEKKSKIIVFSDFYLTKNQQFKNSTRITKNSVSQTCGTFCKFGRLLIKAIYYENFF